MNIRFEYQYRDAGNFKNWGEVVFANPHNVPVEDVRDRARNVLIDSEFFVADTAEVPDLHFVDFDDDLDHGLHHADSFQVTFEPPNDHKGRTIEEFIESLRVASDLA